jgi:DNA-directed RNA polymerase specialized sigma54-like protein
VAAKHGARRRRRANLSECLTLQLRLLPRSEAQMIAIIVCKQHPRLLARRDMKKLMAATGADESVLKEAQGIITSLEPSRRGLLRVPRPTSSCRM